MMNERIRELWRDCVLKHTKDPMNWQTVADEFAELIVAECAMFVVTELEGKVGSRIADATANRLEEHFGVEE